MKSARLATACVLAATAALAACSGGHKGEVVYVTNEFSGDLSVIDPATLAVTRTVQLGKRPRGMALSPDGRTLYVAMTGSPVAPPGVDESKLPPPDKSADGIGVFDVGSGTLQRVIRGVSDPEQLATDPEGHIWAGSEDVESVIELDASGGRLASVALGGSPEGVAVRPDGGAVYVTMEDDAKIAVIDPKAGKVTAQIPTAGRPRSIAFSADGSRAYVTDETGAAVTVIDAKANKRLFDAPIPGGKDVRPMGVVVSPDGTRVYVTTGRGGLLAALDAATGKVLGEVAVGARPWGLAISRDGKRLYTANGPSGDVTVLDAASLKVAGKVKAGDRPWGALAGPAPG
jgi:YVTN family beta-propeller protein